MIHEMQFICLLIRAGMKDVLKLKVSRTKMKRIFI